MFDPGVTSRRSSEGCRGAVLLEVVLAVTLFFTTAVVVLGGLSTAMTALRKVRSDATSSDLAMTKLSEIQMGLVSAEDQGPTPYEEAELAGWSWQIVTYPVMDSTGQATLKQVEVIIRSGSGGGRRLTQFMPATESMDVFATPEPLPSGGGGE